ncbi:hypothetical protein VJ923_07305 [Adlercreutzia sp. R25]|uniref:hypothetical protein n=1 Tax=Adlercreutzia shanghongiae TaxID=3111773 RepID=UPI002DB7E67A|nr:hypothetical protein [Adlercreutzia sp. R25]MEC4272961.1 hypothetical protein [Adlercreutzia sp. R25]
MAENSFGSYLMSSEDGKTWDNVCPIKDYPDLQGDPNTLDSTTLSDPAHTYIDDIEDTGGGLAFTANYDWDTYQKLYALKGEEKYYGVWFGHTEDTPGVFTPDGSRGKFKGKGKLNVTKSGAGVSAVSDMKITITLSEPMLPDLAAPAA